MSEKKNGPIYTSNFKAETEIFENRSGPARCRTIERASVSEPMAEGRPSEARTENSREVGGNTIPNLQKRKNDDNYKNDTVIWTCYTEKSPVFTEKWVYMRQQRETCPKTGRKHWQGFGQLLNRQTFAGVQKLLPRGTHVEWCMDEDKADAYAHKDESSISGTRQQFGKRKIREQGRRTDIERACEDAIKGGIKACSDAMIVKYHRGLERLISLRKSDMVLKEDFYERKRVVWIWGSSGAGKSKKAYFDSIGHTFWKMEENHEWFDRYEGQEVALIDEMTPGKMSFSTWKQITDGYPVFAKVKGGFTDFKPKTIYFTSSYPPEILFCLATENEKTELNRRITEIIKM